MENGKVQRAVGAPTPPHHLENTYSTLIRAPLAPSVKHDSPNLQVTGAFKLQMHPSVLLLHYRVTFASSSQKNTPLTETAVH